jgi:hypothetical protein
MPGKFFYRAVSPDRIDGFPSVLGVTTTASMGDAAMRKVEVGGQFTLAFDHWPYDPDAHSSEGIAEGYYEYGLASRKDGSWSAAFHNFIMRHVVEWLDPEPEEDGDYILRFYIDADVAKAIAASEGEHVNDFNLAWAYTFEAIDWAIARLTAQSSVAEAIGQLIGVLQAGKYDYIIPADPGNLDSWGSRVKSVYWNLCDHSSKRDKRFEHTPVKYWLSATRDHVIVIQITPGEPHQNSFDYVRPDELKVVYTGSFAAPIATSAAAVQEISLANGTEVTWRDSKITFTSSDREWECYYTPEPQNPVTIPEEMKEAMKGGGVVSQQGENGYVWVRVNIYGQDYFVYVRSALLSKK